MCKLKAMDAIILLIYLHFLILVYQFLADLQDSFIVNKWKEYSTDITDVPDYEFIIKRFQLKSDVSSNATEVLTEGLVGADHAAKFSSLSHSELSLVMVRTLFYILHLMFDVCCQQHRSLWTSFLQSSSKCCRRKTTSPSL